MRRPPPVPHPRRSDEPGRGGGRRRTGRWSEAVGEGGRGEGDGVRL